MRAHNFALGRRPLCVSVGRVDNRQGKCLDARTLMRYSMWTVLLLLFLASPAVHAADEPKAKTTLYVRGVFDKRAEDSYVLHAEDTQKLLADLSRLEIKRAEGTMVRIIDLHNMGTFVPSVVKPCATSQSDCLALFQRNDMFAILELIRDKDVKHGALGKTSITITTTLNLITASSIRDPSAQPNKMVSYCDFNEDGSSSDPSCAYKNLVRDFRKLYAMVPQQQSSMPAPQAPPPTTSTPTNTDTTADSLTKGADPRLSRKRLIAGLVLVVVGPVIALIGGAGPLRDGLSSSEPSPGPCDGESCQRHPPTAIGLGGALVGVGATATLTGAGLLFSLLPRKAPPAPPTQSTR